jgi:hypothetical protein
VLNLHMAHAMVCRRASLLLLLLCQSSSSLKIEGWLGCLFEASRGSLASLRPDEVAVLIRGLAGVQV